MATISCDSATVKVNGVEIHGGSVMVEPEPLPEFEDIERTAEFRVWLKFSSGARLLFKKIIRAQRKLYFPDKRQLRKMRRLARKHAGLIKSSG